MERVYSEQAATVASPVLSSLANVCACVHAHLLGSQHGGHLGRAEVPAPDRQQSLEPRLRLLQLVEPLEPAREKANRTPCSFLRVLLAETWVADAVTKNVSNVQLTRAANVPQFCMRRIATTHSCSLYVCQLAQFQVSFVD